MKSEKMYGIENLTKREYQILTLMLDGISTKEIAQKLNLASNTISKNKKNIFYKLKTKNLIKIYEMNNSKIKDL
jgi:DNA-binding CsgD family transcriptional regulator